MAGIYFQTEESLPYTTLNSFWRLHRNTDSLNSVGKLDRSSMPCSNVKIIKNK